MITAYHIVDIIKNRLILALSLLLEE